MSAVKKRTKQPAASSRDAFRYRQLAGEIEKKIFAGLYPPGDRLPSIRSLHRQLGLTVVLVTHDLDTLAGLAARVAVLAEQRILALGTIDEIMKVDHPFIRNFFCCDRAQRALQSRMSEGKV